MTMNWLGIIVALGVIFIVLADAFEVMILPRRISHAFRPARLFYRLTWFLWRKASRLVPAGKWRHGFFSVFGPLSLLALLSMWGIGLIVGFALLHWSIGTVLTFPRDSNSSFGTYLYFSGTTFVTLGYGDIVPTRIWGRALSVAEAGIGFGFLAIMVSYLPVLYQAFSRREITISLLDARAGSPPTAGELLRRLAADRCMVNAEALLVEWERWAAELLESHVSFPVVSYYRSQHDNQSWIATLAIILDTSALLISSIDGPDRHQARLTFAMARHAAVDLGRVFHTPPRSPETDRLSPTDLIQLRDSLNSVGLPLHDNAANTAALSELRSLYEPFVNALGTYFEFAVPLFLPAKLPVDNWQTSPWTRRSPNLAELPMGLSPASVSPDVH